MKKIVKKYRISKFKCFMNGLVFAVITVIALTLCLANIYAQSEAKIAILLPFFIAIISMLLGFVSMFRHNGIQKQIQQ